MPVCAATDFLSTGHTPEALDARLQSGQLPLVIDVRKPVEFRIGHMPGAVNIPLDDPAQQRDSLARDQAMLICCSNGARTRKAGPVLMDAGSTENYHLEGAFLAWIRKGLEIEKGAQVQ